jgi:DNA-binding transcriptional LysR family regulator
MISPDLKQLHYFVVLSEELHYGRAAELLGIQQPPLTVSIQKLERTVGCELVVRGRKITLSPAGVRFATEARRTIDQAERAVLLTQRTARGESGELRVGVPPSVMLTGLPSAIRKYRVRYPDVAFTLRDMGTSAIEQALRRGEIDLGFLRETRPRAPLDHSLFLTEPVVAVLPSNHALASPSRNDKRGELNLRALRKEPFVSFPRHIGPEFYDALLADCGDAGFAPNIVQEATQWHSVISFVEAGMGVALAPACVEKFRWPGVAFRTLEGLTTKVYAARSDSVTAAQFLLMAQRSVTRGRENG